MVGPRVVALICLVVAVTGCSGASQTQTPTGGASASAETATPWPTPELGEDEIAFPAADGIVIIATLRGDGPVGVVLAHMNGGQAATTRRT